MVRARRPAGVEAAVLEKDGLTAASDAVEEVGVKVRQAGSLCLCTTMRNFSFLLGFMDGKELNRSL